MGDKTTYIAHKIGDVNVKLGYFPIGFANGLFQKVRNLGYSYPSVNEEVDVRTCPRETVNTELGFCSNIDDLSSPEDIAKSLDAVKSVNGRWFRANFPFEGYEDNFEKTDEIVDEAQKRGINVLPTISTRNFRAPDSMKDYLKYVEDVVGRYSGKVRVYNIWNEPNAFAFWLGSPKAFAHLLKATHRKMVDADRSVLTSVNFNWLPWKRPWVHESLKMLEKENALKDVDVVGLDAYPGSYEPGNALSWRDKITGTRKCLKSLGHDDKEVWVMEYGCYAYDDTKLTSHTPEAQTRFLRDATKVISSEDVPVAIWYCLRDPTHLQHPLLRVLPQEYNFGILKSDYTPKDPEVLDVIRSLT